jgi:hypothetical protein
VFRIFSFGFGGPSESAKLQNSTSSRTGLPIFWTNMQPISDHWIKMFPVSDISLWFELSLCKSAKYQLSTSSGSGLAFMEIKKSTHFYNFRDWRPVAPSAKQLAMRNDHNANVWETRHDPIPTQVSAGSVLCVRTIRTAVATCFLYLKS